MTKRKFALASLTAFSVFGTLASAQSASLREELLKKAKEIYGDAAPTKLTFVTVGKTDATSHTKAAKAAKGESSAKMKTMEGPSDTHAVQVRSTRVGESGTGVILESKDDQVYLDANPCSGRIMVFTSPFSQDPAGNATCKGRSMPQFKFVQK